MSIIERVRRRAAVAVAGALTLALLPAGGAMAGTQEVCDAAPADPSFSDVDQGDLFADEILCVAGYRIVGGYPDGTFRPVADVTRGQAARFLVGFIETAAGTALPLPGDNPFEDVPENGTFRDDILKLHGAGIIDGVSATAYDPLGTLTRGQMTKVVVLGLEHLGLTLDGSDAGFSDVPADGAFKPFIDKLANEGIVGGYEDGTFRPNREIERRQLTKFVANGAGYADDANAWDPTRLVGPVLTAGVVSVEAGGSIEVTVTVYDEDANPVAGARIDAFAVNADQPFDEEGAPNYASDVTVNGSGNGTGAPGPLGQGRIEQGDPTTDGAGKLALTITSSTAQQLVLIAWQGAEFDEFDNDDVAADDRGSIPLTFTEPPSAVTLSGDRRTGVYPYGDDASITAQLVDDDGAAVNRSGARVHYTVTRGGTPISPGEVVHEGDATTDSGGRARFISPAPADPDADTDDQTEDTITVYVDRDGDGTQDENETVEGELTITYDDTSEDQVDSASLHHRSSNNPYSPTTSSARTSTSHTVYAVVQNVYGDGVDGVQVDFEYSLGRTSTVKTDGNGVATLTYTGPPAKQTETVRAWVDGNWQNGTADRGNQLQPGPDFSTNTLTQHWVVPATRAEHDTTGDGRAIAGVDAGANVVDVTGDLRRFAYDGDDTFEIDGAAVSLSAFEQALANAGSGDRLAVDFQPKATSTYTFTNG